MNSPSLTQENIVQRSLHGVKWTFVLAPAAACLSYLSAVLLGRASPLALGTYGVFQIAITIASTFLVFGGSNVIVNFLPRIVPEKRASFLVTYFGLCLGLAVPLSASVYLLAGNSPAIFSLVFSFAGDRPQLFLWILLLFTPVLGQTFVWSILNARLSVSLAAVTRAAVPAAAFLMLLTGLFTPYLTGNSPSAWIFFSLLTAELVSFLIGLLALRREAAFSSIGKLHTYLPPGFWKFSIPFHLSTVLMFLVSQCDQIAVMQILGVESLGFYKAVYTLASIVIWFPNILTGALYPAFCHFHTLLDFRALERIYKLTTSAAYLVASSAGTFLMLFGREALQLFGASFTESGLSALFVFCAGYALIFPLYIANGTLTVSAGLTHYNLIPNLIGAGTALTLSLLLTRRFGLIGAAYANLMTLFFITVFTWAIIRQVLKIKISPVYVLPGLLPLTGFVCLKLGLAPTMAGKIALFALLEAALLSYAWAAKLFTLQELAGLFQARAAALKN